jgi:hypothetical protein
VRLAESGQHDGGGHGEEEPSPGDGGQPVPGLVAEEDDPDDGGRDGLGQHDARGGHRDTAAFQGGGVEHERDDPGRDDRVGGRVLGELQRREAIQDAGGDAEHPETEACHQAKRRGPVGLVEPGRGQADHGQARYGHDQRELEHRAHLSGALGARGGAEQPDADHHAGHCRPLAPGQGHPDQPGGNHRGHGEVRGDKGLDGKDGKALQGHELGHEAQHVEADADQEPPLVQHPHHESRIDTRGGFLRVALAGRAYGDGLHH